MNKSLDPKENQMYFHVFVPKEVKIVQVKISRGMIAQMFFTCVSALVIVGLCIAILGKGPSINDVT